MKLHNASADIFVPSQLSAERAIARTTHLGIGAHPDDLEVMALDVIALCHDTDALWFTGVVLTDGRSSPRHGAFEKTSDAEMRLVRRQEQNRAARLGEYSAVIQLDYSSALVRDPARQEVVDDLAEILRCAQPERLFTHAPTDMHDTHVATCVRVIEALRSLPVELRPQQVLGCEVWRGLDWLVGDERAVLTGSKNEAWAMQMLAVFESQLAGGKRYDLATLARRRANATFFSPDHVDDTPALTFAVDLSSLVTDPTQDIADFADARIRKLSQDVRERLARVSKSR
jgi:LmbE family N-acetylglucosaminyl deacetylase